MSAPDAIETEFVCPECGLQVSAEVPAETFDGFDGDLYIRVCLREGRVYMHSRGDIRGYPPEQQSA